MHFLNLVQTDIWLKQIFPLFHFFLCEAMYMYFSYAVRQSECALMLTLHEGYEAPTHCSNLHFSIVPRVIASMM